MTEQKLDRTVVREIKTIRYMIEIYCKAHHNTDANICDECRDLLEYSETRIRKCPQLEHKPPCRECTIHCFAPKYRDQTRQIMRFAGPRMIRHHPLLAVRHLMKKPPSS